LIDYDAWLSLFAISMMIRHAIRVIIVCRHDFRYFSLFSFALLFLLSLFAIDDAITLR